MLRHSFQFSIRLEAIIQPKKSKRKLLVQNAVQECHFSFYAILDINELSRDGNNSLLIVTHPNKNKDTFNQQL